MKQQDREQKASVGRPSCFWPLTLSKSLIYKVVQEVDLLDCGQERSMSQGKSESPGHHSVSEQKEQKAEV